MSEPRAVEPLDTPPDALVVLPGSKSITNRAALTAALADGASTLTGALVADDTEAMFDCLRRLGATVEVDGDVVHVVGVAGKPAGATEGGVVELDARLSGTTSRFVLPVCAIGDQAYRVDGAGPLRGRPMGPTIDALRHLGVRVDEQGAPGHLPLVVHGGTAAGRRVEVPGAASSQFVSGLLLAGPCLPGGLEVAVVGALVSRPYVAMTLAVMRLFGADIDERDGGVLVVEPSGYGGRDYAVEPDASAASYFFAAAAITGGTVTVRGLTADSLQGDVAFVDVLEQMGAAVERGADAIVVRGTGQLHGVDVDLSDLSDTAQTLAAVAVFADSPTKVHGIGFIRRKETDRIAHPVHELRRAGIEAHETDDGFVVHPGRPRPATIETYGDHRMAMSFALLGLRAPGIRIADPDCVAKTFPGYWTALDALVGQ